MPKPATRKTEWKDEYTLLCERCGYIIEDLDHSLPCPECGKPISESLPECRVGTPWQQKPGFHSLLITWWMTIRHPMRTLDRIQIVGSFLDSLKLTYCTTAMIVLFGSVFLLQLRTLFLIGKFELIASLMLLLNTFTYLGMGLILLLLLTWVETTGLRFFGRRRNSRIDPTISKAITSHSCAGWLLGSIFASVGLIVGYPIYELATPSIPMSINSTEDIDAILQNIRNSQAPSTPGWAEIIQYSLPWAGFLIGFLFFETFAYLGLRRCKYANRSRPTDQPQP